MADIFISHSSADREKAKALAEAIQQQGWSVWWDRKIPYGKSFDDVIEQELDAARCVVVVWTKMSVASYWVKIEAAEGARRHVLLPVFLDDVKIPLEFRRLQAANLTDWQPGLPNSEFDQLLMYVGEMLGKPTLADPGEPEVNRPQPARNSADPDLESFQKRAHGETNPTASRMAGLTPSFESIAMIGRTIRNYRIVSKLGRGAWELFILLSTSFYRGDSS